MAIDINDVPVNVNLPDSDVIDKLTKATINGLGFPAELISNIKDIEFATLVKTLNGVLADVVETYQDLIDPHLTHHVKLLIRHDDNVQEEIRKIIADKYSTIMKKLPKDTKVEYEKEEIIDALVYEAVESLIVTLPRPPIQDADTTSDDFDDYKTRIEDAVDIYLSEEAIPNELMSIDGISMSTIRDFIVNTLLRKWVNENKYVSELTDMFTLDGDNLPRLDIVAEYKDYVNTVAESLKPLVRDLKKGKIIIRPKEPVEEPIEEPTNVEPTNNNINEPQNANDDAGAKNKKDDGGGGEKYDDLDSLLGV